MSSASKGKRKASVLDMSEDRPSKPRTLGGDRPRETVAVREIASTSLVSTRPHLFEGANLLPVPPLLTFLSANVEGSDLVFEARNSEGDGPTEVTFADGKQTLWLDYLPSPVLALTASTTFCGVATQDGSVNVYSHTGRRLVVKRGSRCCLNNVWQIDGNSESGVAWRDDDARLQVGINDTHSFWSAKLNKCEECCILLSTYISGTPPLLFAELHDILFSWTKISERWWAEGSDVWQGRQRTSKDKDVVASIEGAIGSTSIPAPHKERPTWWNTALTLGHLESKLHAAKTLDSAIEYKQALLIYARKLADEGFRAKAEELIKELFGPIFWRPGGRDESWTPVVAGMAKRDLLREVLSVFARSKTLTKLALDWQDTLKKASNDDQL
ncbi:hypothetical protein P692DRAFT_20952439 [Suillus brevipes Sb2]|nr:hypothetical protein P692DRAFT_20952439 [Suillus brevipes Sb2]